MKRTLDWLIVILCLLLGGLLLVPWPFVVMANIMALGGGGPNYKAPIVMLLLFYLFHFAVLFYPVVYIACLITTIIKMIASQTETNSNRCSAFFFARFPLFYVFVVFSTALIVLVCSSL